MIIFGRGYHEEHFCKIILNLDQWFRRCYQKYLLSTGLFVQHSQTICVILVEDIPRNIIVILNLDQWLRRCSLKTFLIWSSSGPFDEQSGTVVQFWTRVLRGKFL